MKSDCHLDWLSVRNIVGSCMRPGGSTLTERALEFCGLPQGSLVADIGCGAGGTLEYLEGTGLCHAVGLDYSMALLEESIPRLASRELVRGRAEGLPFKNSLFHALFCECVLSILRDKIGALHECARVLRAGGFLILSDVFVKYSPALRRPGAHAQGLGTEVVPTKDDLLSFLEKTGCSLILWEEHKMLLKEFAAAMILAGVRLSDARSCRQEPDRKRTDRPGLSYFLLVARKAAALELIGGSKRDGK